MRQRHPVVEMGVQIRGRGHAAVPHDLRQRGQSDLGCCHRGEEVGPLRERPGQLARWAMARSSLRRLAVCGVPMDVGNAISCATSEVAPPPLHQICVGATVDG